MKCSQMQYSLYVFLFNNVILEVFTLAAVENRLFT